MRTPIYSPATTSAHEHHDYQLYLAVNDIGHTRTKAQSPQTNGLREHFHKTILNEFYQVAFRKRIYTTLEDLQVTGRP